MQTFEEWYDSLDNDTILEYELNNTTLESIYLDYLGEFTDMVYENEVDK